MGGGRIEDSMLPDPIEEDFPPSRYEPPDVSFGLDKDDLGGDKKIWYGFCLYWDKIECISVLPYSKLLKSCKAKCYL